MVLVDSYSQYQEWEYFAYGKTSAAWRCCVYGSLNSFVKGSVIAIASN